MILSFLEYNHFNNVMIVMDTFPEMFSGDYRSKHLHKTIRDAMDSGLEPSQGPPWQYSG